MSYISSSTDLGFIQEQKLNPENFKYKIIKTYDNPGDKIIHEAYLHQKFDVKLHTSFYNKANQTPFGFDTTGISGEGHHLFGKTGKLSPRFGIRGEDHPLFGRKKSPEHKRKISESQVGKRNHRHGKRNSLEHKRKISENHVPRKWNEAERQIFSKNQRGEKNHMFGKKLSKKRKKQISEQQSGIKHNLAKIIMVKDLFGREMGRGLQGKTMKKLGIPTMCIQYINNGKIYADLVNVKAITRKNKSGYMKFCGWSIETLIRTPQNP